MSELAKRTILKLLKKILANCRKMKKEIKMELARSPQSPHKKGWEADIKTIEGIIPVVRVVEADVIAGKIGKCLALVLQQTADKSEKELTKIPTKKQFCSEIIESFKQIHKEVLPLVK